MRIRILRPALEDLAAGREFYDRRQQGIGSYFSTACSPRSKIDSLVLYAGIHPIRFGHHRLLAKRFPYAVYYRVAGHEVTVHRVLDCRREPKWIQSALRKSG